MEANPYKAPVNQAKAIKRRTCRRRMTTGQRIVVSSIATASALICTVFAFGDIGFDHPGRYGLDFGHFLLLVSCQAVLALSWIGLAVAFERRSLLLWIPVVIVATLVALYYA